MICGLVLSVALVGQQATYLGKPGGPDISRMGMQDSITVATSPEAMARFWKDLKDRDPNDVTQAIGLAAIPYGVQVRIVKPVKLSETVKGAVKTIDGYFVQILEGPLAGSVVVASARNTYKGESRELAASAPYEPKNSGAVRLWLGGRTVDGVGMPPLVAASLDELAGIGELEGKVDKKGTRIVNGVAMVAQLGYGTHAEGLEILDYKTKVDGKTESRPACVVKILDGPAAGRIVYADGADIHVDEVTGRQAASPQPAAASRAEELKKTAAKQKARRSARVRSGKAREADDAAQVAKAQAEYKAALPFMLESQRLQLEAMNQAQRSAALQRMAAADERMARAMEFKAGVPQMPNFQMPTKPINPFPDQE